MASEQRKRKWNDGSRSPDHSRQTRVSTLYDAVAGRYSDPAMHATRADARLQDVSATKVS